MSFAVRLLLLCAISLSLVPPPTLAAAAKTTSRRSSGNTYVRLTDWAKANQFTIRLDARGKSLELSNRLARLSFNLDPTQNLRRAEINGVEVWLAFPLLYKGGAVSISQLDVEKTLQPILGPRPNPPGIKVKTICLDPGHGGRDPGYRIGANEEKKYTLLLAQELRDQLQKAGFKVVLTRNTDVYVERADRPALAKKQKADLFVSLHFNALEGRRGDAQGVETYCLTPESATSTNADGKGDTRHVTGNRSDDRNALLAYHVQKALVKELAVQDRGVRRARWEVLREAQLPAILVEAGFMSHPVEGKKIFDAGYRRKLARAIADGIQAYQRNIKG